MEMEMEMESREHSTSKSIPPDIILDILAKLPVKSIVRFRCVSKLCNSSVVTPSFVSVRTIHFPIKPTGLLITCSARLQSSQMFFYADFNGGSAVPLLTIPPRFSRYTTQSLNGLVCLDFGICAKICNPSTRQAITLPFVIPVSSPSASSTYFCVNSFGFDPVTKQYKVLNSWKVPGRDPEYRVFTLGTKSWRLVRGGPLYYPQRESICIGGIIYFRSWTSTAKDSRAVLVAFEVHNETFQVIQIPEEISSEDHENETNLIVFAGHPAIVCYDQMDEDGSLIVWTVEDYFWIKLGIVLPSGLQELQDQQNQLYFVAGTIHTGELLLVQRSLSKPFYMLYYDVSKNSIRRVQISGLPDYGQFSDFSAINTVTVSNYEENMLSFT
ncbi:hypothetical protein ACOSQ3_017996 [Xanthoceras sorbifolium]